LAWQIQKRKVGSASMNPQAYLEMAETENVHWWFKGRRDIISQHIASIPLPKNAEILEIGCGTGGNLAMLSQFGRISALEVDPLAISIAEKKTGDKFDITHGSCPHHIPFENKKFDLICMFDVLEHISEDTETLVQLKSLLSEKGKILITVPAYKFLWNSHDEFLHHKRRYSLNEIIEITEKIGFKVWKKTFFNTFLFPVLLFTRLLHSVLKFDFLKGTKTPYKFINHVLYQIFRFESYVLKYVSLPAGSSILVIMEKK
jgi:SAM-dependent methyltransferase